MVYIGDLIFRSSQGVWVTLSVPSKAAAVAQLRAARGARGVAAPAAGAGDVESEFAGKARLCGVRVWGLGLT